MEFKLTDEQQMIRESAEGFLADRSNSEAVRAAMATELGYDDALWQSVCSELYWHAVHIPEEYGGLGLGYVELAVVLEAMGERLLCAPFLSTVGFAVNAVLLAGDEAQKSDYLGQIIEGRTATLAWHGGGRDWSPAAVTASFEKDGDDFILNGDYRYVIDGHSAELLVVAARDAEELALFVVRADDAAVSREWTPTMDQTRKQANVSLKGLRLPASAKLAAASGDACLQQILDLASIAIAAEQAGGAKAILQASVDYTLEREQFGRSIASFQAIKHKAADMKLKSEVARSAVYYAACVATEVLAANDGDADVASQLSDAASMAKAYCSETYFYNAGNGLQMFGGVGFTWEYDVHLFFKRAKSSETLLGDGAWHRERIAKGLLDSSDVDDEVLA